MILFKEPIFFQLLNCTSRATRNTLLYLVFLKRVLIKDGRLYRKSIYSLSVSWHGPRESFGNYALDFVRGWHCYPPTPDTYSVLSNLGFSRRTHHRSYGAGLRSTAFEVVHSSTHREGYCTQSEVPTQWHSKHSVISSIPTNAGSCWAQSQIHRQKPS